MKLWFICIFLCLKSNVKAGSSKCDIPKKKKRALPRNEEATKKRAKLTVEDSFDQVICSSVFLMDV